MLEDKDLNLSVVYVMVNFIKIVIVHYNNYLMCCDSFDVM